VFSSSVFTDALSPIDIYCVCFP